MDSTLPRVDGQKSALDKVISDVCQGDSVSASITIHRSNTSMHAYLLDKGFEQENSKLFSVVGGSIKGLFRNVVVYRKAQRNDGQSYEIYAFVEKGTLTLTKSKIH